MCQQAPSNPRADVTAAITVKHWQTKVRPWGSKSKPQQSHEAGDNMAMSAGHLMQPLVWNMENLNKSADTTALLPTTSLVSSKLSSCNHNTISRRKFHNHTSFPNSQRRVWVLSLNPFLYLLTVATKGRHTWRSIAVPGWRDTTALRKQPLKSEAYDLWSFHMGASKLNIWFQT